MIRQIVQRSYHCAKSILHGHVTPDPNVLWYNGPQDPLILHLKIIFLGTFEKCRLCWSFNKGSGIEEYFTHACNLSNENKIKM